MAMKTVTLILIGALALVAAGSHLQAAETTGSDQALGEKMVRQFWAYVKVPNMKAVAKSFASGYQSVDGTAGVLNREQEIETIKGLTLGKYESAFSLKSFAVIDS